MSAPLLAIVGAPNVGKSTLFNRLVGGRRAIVTDEAGVTRDRQYGEFETEQGRLCVVDTGGLTDEAAEPYADAIARQAERAMDEADCLLLVVDARAGITAVDREVATRLRRRGTPIVLVANKIDAPGLVPLAHGLYELGLGEPQPVSAEHGVGIGELLEHVQAVLARSGQHPARSGESEASALSLAIVGRPNVGKSSLFNRLVGEERALVSEVPGTTRDSVDTLLVLGSRRYRRVDTAGLRRRGRVDSRAERFSVARARRNIEGCDVALLLLDATRPVSAQDTHIAGYVAQRYKPLIVAWNKWDLVGDREREAKRLTDEARSRLRFAKQAPVLLISARTGQRTNRVLDLAGELHDAGGLEVPTPALNRWLQELGLGREDSGAAGTRFYYATQTGTHPPSFVLFCSDPRRVHFSLRRRLDNSLRERFHFDGAPIRLAFRGRRA